MVTLQTMCKEGDLVGLRNFFCERPPPAVPFVANSETAETSDIGDSTDTALEAWRKIYPEANSRLNGQTLIEIASASGHIGAFVQHFLPLKRSPPYKCSHRRPQML